MDINIGHSEHDKRMNEQTMNKFVIRDTFKMILFDFLQKINISYAISSLRTFSEHIVNKLFIHGFVLSKWGVNL